MHTCCDPILHAWFTRERLFKLGLRHGVHCRRTPGLIEEIKKAQWWSKGRRVLTGETYR
jgi:hypothetical protein